MRLKLISQQILSVFVLVVTSCFVITGWLVLRYSSDIVTQRISEGDQRLAARIAQEVADEWASVDPILTVLVDFYRLRQMEAAGAQEILDQYKAQFPMIMHSWVADLNGDTIARTGDEALKNVSGLWRFVIAKGGKKLVSDVYLEAATSEQMLNVSLPIESSGEVIGVLSTDINLQSILRSLKLFGSVGDGNLVVVDAHGKVVAHSQIGQVPELDLSELPVVAAVLDGQEGTMSGYSDEFGRPALGAYSPIEELGWGVLIQRPLSDIDAALGPVRRTIGFATLGAILGATLAGWLMARYLARPIVQLANASERITRGDLSTFVDITASNEIGVLANSFNEMTVSLKESRDDLLLWAEELEQSEWKYRTLTENINVGIIRGSPGLDGRPIEANPAVLEIFGYESKEEFLSSNVMDKFRNPNDRKGFLTTLETDGSVRKKEIQLHKKDGTLFEASISAVAVRDEAGHVQFYDGILEDITERKKAEHEILKLNEELERRVHLRTTQLELANTELESFAYSVSHDLRAPLRAIDGFSRILMDEHFASLPPDAQRYLGMVRNNTHDMDKLIDDLLAFSRLARKEMVTQPVSPNEVVNLALKELEGDMEGRAVELTIADLPDCQADPSLIKQVYINLLENALKFTRGKTPAMIEIGYLELDGEQAYFVKDNGVGFDMQYADKLFGAFQRLHQVEDFEGTGVGLTTVQRIIRRHGGRVWAEAEVDQGATFYFTCGGIIPND